MPGEGARRRPQPLVSTHFDDEVWTEEVERLREGRARGVATRARREIEREGGVRIAELKACEELGPDGTHLEGCVKAYLPYGGDAPSQQPWGFVLSLGEDNVLEFLAFGSRHPGPGERSVYARAHKRIHGRWPNE